MVAGGGGGGGGGGSHHSKNIQSPVGWVLIAL